jgi:hypothetical protein
MVQGGNVRTRAVTVQTLVSREGPTAGELTGQRRIKGAHWKKGEVQRGKVRKTWYTEIPQKKSQV